MHDQMQTVIGEWLSAHENFHANAGTEATNAYCAADERLLAAFVADWNVSDSVILSRAYQAFRQALIASAAWGKRG